MAGAVRVRVLGRDRLGEVTRILAAWEPPGGSPLGLHVGDIGWHARLPDVEFDGTVRVLERAGGVVAVGVFEPGLARPRLAPGAETDPVVCAALADEVESDPGEQVWSDAAPGTLLRTELSARGWTLDPEPWVALYRPLSRGDGGLGKAGDEAVRPVDGETDVADRVAVQRASFEGSTFTVNAWHRMAATRAYDPALDLLARDTDGQPVAAATAWAAGPGRCGILEPMGTHRAARGRGHGRRVVLAALARAGASGVTVHTPASNSGAVATYVSCGLRPLQSTEALVRGIQRSTSASPTP